MMDERAFGWTGRRVPAVGQGTWKMENDSRAEAVRAIRRGLDLGLTHVDTAEMYGGGRVEDLVGEAIAGLRDQVFLVSKVLPSNATYSGTLRACEQSLARLRTECLDVYLLHWRGKTPLEETVRAFERLVEQGKTRFWGVSNFDVDDLEEARAIAGDGRIACNQVLHHLLDRTIENELVPWCERHGVAVVGYSPFGQGRFPAARSAGIGVLEKIASDHGVSSRAVVLRFLVRRSSLFAIPKASRVSHVEENAAAAALVLTDDEIRRIDEAFPLAGRRRRLSSL
ncbi:MAG: hypothetical protein QOD06_2470 [Candidatus Binatota bacterium]|nr:hypothetical protein [Candidatus Binatota bacterium]